MKVYGVDHPEGFSNLELDIGDLMNRVILVLADLHEDAKQIWETAECLEILGIKPPSKEIL